MSAVTDDPLLRSAAARRRERFLALIRGERVGLWPASQRFALWLASLGYGVAVRLRNFAYDRGWKVQRVAAPVISVGNLTVGGTGKTPCVEFIARQLRGFDLQVTMLSRGYGSEAGVNDEALVLEENLPDVPHLQGADRVALARIALEELESDVLLLDDGFQHRRLGRDLDVVLIDATDPFGGGYLLPRGLLREPIAGLRRADAVLLTRCDQAGAERVQQIRDQLDRQFPGKPILETEHRPLHLANADGARETLESLRGRAVAGFCGLGNPEGFRRTLVDLSCRLVGFRAYPDHHPYGRDDVANLAVFARSLPDDAVLVTTQKDLVKLRVSELGGRPLWAVRIGLTFRAGEEEFLHLLRSRLPAAPPDTLD
ncbi:MAG: tetraacyldisaccharide 4'-kinase [Gemmataceae bacterium]